MRIEGVEKIHHLNDSLCIFCKLPKTEVNELFYFKIRISSFLCKWYTVGSVAFCFEIATSSDLEFELSALFEGADCVDH